MTQYGLGTFRDTDGIVFGAAIVDDRVLRLADLTPATPTVDAVLAEWPVASATLAAALPGARPGRALGDLTVLAPFTPGQLFQSGANYHKHVVDLTVAAAIEAGRPEAEARARAKAMMDEQVENGTPYVFIGLPSAICGPYDDIVLPPIGVRHDWELELGVVIGHEARNVRREDAMAHVAAYVIANDLTTRDRVFRPDLPSIGTDWLAGKNSPTFSPLGPWVVPAGFVADPMDLRLTLRLNGETMQDESTADMIFDIAGLIEHVSSITALRPGDLLLTGSPAGNGAHHGRYLKPGDVLTAAITGLGEQRNTCMAMP
ncbi:fumarylacetoacetate hydrolase family protein [Amycolatopsis pithecellobii]|uniref:Hydrolase n=1 Tax=Amycolatopsis pithecellobii TaxID=664692 RepID=A0A6N7YTZ7_9PSEU|nr:fumarylacetoacetate hydrolase family protein [Amycolatopsis pithecellobii]MTD56525.1 hydrolase [Amycolatopsis pithecellobii]